jgi:hypothetical protein
VIYYVYSSKHAKPSKYQVKNLAQD